MLSFLHSYLRHYEINLNLVQIVCATDIDSPTSQLSTVSNNWVENV